ncbi:helix-turn-helix domain-containing protein [Pseudoduganella sp. FT26W]|uniref:Helix-turn-helix domain-containing protein n=1 Tax=Duganella aquatilis TaxID=2666082 RepID=A0A844D8R2_9BURK|nr:helix-turn-helix domain-containing protein [Duganella aquatilis]MRW84576.1 helix-turn-helix domain-containing protein [Duganella aquatilis]
MNQSLAYHVVVHALEGRAGWTPMSRFASVVAHTIDGHLTYERYNAAGCSRAAQGAKETQIEQAVREFFALDLAPGVRLIGGLSSPAGIVEGFNEYNASAGVAVRTSVSMPAAGGRAPVVVARREMRVEAADPAPCRIGTLALFEALISNAERNARNSQPPTLQTLSGLARELGVEGSAAGEVALVFESEGAMPIAELARKLGCHPRSLARKLQSEGLTAEAIRSAARIVRASDRLVSEDSLTTIAMEEGFADLAHMTRSFKLSAGMQPSLLRRLVRADESARSANTAGFKPNPFSVVKN